MHIDFKDGIPKDLFFYCYSPQAKTRGVFVREPDAIKNEYNESVGDYEYTTVMMTEKMKVGESLTVECSYEKRGAPLIVISDEIVKRGDTPYYGAHFEAVAFEEGMNVWYNIPSPRGSEKPLITSKLHHEPIPTPNFSRVTLTLTLLEGAIRCTMNDRSVVISHPDIPASAYVGITGCEGINRFYTLTRE